MSSEGAALEEEKLDAAAPPGETNGGPPPCALAGAAVKHWFVERVLRCSSLGFIARAAEVSMSWRALADDAAFEALEREHHGPLPCAAHRGGGG